MQSASITCMAAALCVAQSLACHADRDSFCNTVYPCDPTAASDTCGTACDGKPMFCLDMEGLGQGFCVERCDPAQETRDPTHLVCVSSGALLQKCQPYAGTRSDPSAGCPEKLHCLRTKVSGDDGVCTTGRVCNETADCGDSAENECGGNLIRHYLGPIGYSDHFQCVQPRCSTNLQSCQGTQSCLASYYDTADNVPDICVPHCDAGGHCAPGSACLQTSLKPGSPSICVPGVPGVACQSIQDCLLTDCADSGVGFSICALQCMSDFDCDALNTPGNSFRCLAGAPSEQSHHCMNSSPFQGPSCEMTSDCPQKEGQQCFRYSPYTQDASARGQCRLPCGDDGSCPARGGLPHVCLAGGAGGCYPGNFGLPCARSEECLSQLTCERITADARYAEGTTICTISCHEDINCSTSPWTSRGGFCDGGFCHMAGPNDAPCTRDAQCLSNRCSAIGDASGTCSAVVVGG